MTLRRAAFVLALATGCFPCGPGFTPPMPDSCTVTSGGDVTSFAIGPGGDGAFVAWNDGDAPSLVTGGQGATMLVMRIAVRGNQPPTCLAQRTVVANQVSDATPRTTYAAPDGSRVTKDMYIVLGGFPFGPLDVSTTVAGTTVTRHLGGAPRDLAAPLDLRGADGSD